MDVRMVCPNRLCGATLTARAEHIGKMGRCKQCGTKFRIPGESTTERYEKAVKVLQEAENLFQDGSGTGEEEWGDALVQFSPESIKAVLQRGWKKRGFSEPTNEFLVRVLARIAAERTPEEKQQAIGALQSILDLPDDNTTGHMNLRGASIRELGKLNALPGVEARDSECPGDAQPFRLASIEPGDIGPLGANSPSEKPNLESQSLWQLVLSPTQDYQEVIKRFEANYSRWKSTFDRRSHSLVLAAYGFSLERLGHLREAVLALRWACKLYPYKGFGACDALPEVEARLRASAPVQ